jgi:hypothetical protein
VGRDGPRMTDAPLLEGRASLVSSNWVAVVFRGSGLELRHKLAQTKGVQPLKPE